MGQKIMIVVDMQNDFIDGVLGTKEAQAILPDVIDAVKNFDGEVIYTRDTHFDNYMETMEGKKLPVPHCIEGTKGWEICDGLKALQTEETLIFDKLTFGSTELAEYLEGIEGLDGITLIGVCTDICVISNAILIKAYMPDMDIKVIAKCCAGVTPESHNNALGAMKMCHIDIV